MVPACVLKVCCFDRVHRCHSWSLVCVRVSVSNRTETPFSVMKTTNKQTNKNPSPRGVSGEPLRTRHESKSLTSRLCTRNHVTVQILMSGTVSQCILYNLYMINMIYFHSHLGISGINTHKYASSITRRCVYFYLYHCVLKTKDLKNNNKLYNNRRKHFFH